MNPFTLKGKWGRSESKLYNTFVSPALKRIYDQMIDRFVPAEEIDDGNRILDVGCGRGYLVTALARRFPGASFTGVDLSDEMVRSARQAADGLCNAAFEKGDALALPFQDSSFDAVVSLASVKHWPDPGAGIREIVRVLKPNGFCFVMELHREASREASFGFVKRWRFLPWPLPHLVISYFQRFVAGGGTTPEELGSLLSAAGIEGATVKALEEFPAVIASGKKRSETTEIV